MENAKVKITRKYLKISIAAAYVTAAVMIIFSMPTFESQTNTPTYLRILWVICTLVILASLFLVLKMWKKRKVAQAFKISRVAYFVSIIPVAMLIGEIIGILVS